MSTEEARNKVILAALRCLAAERAEPHAHAGDEEQYASDELALAARDLTEATNALLPSQRPVGWDNGEVAR